MEISLKLLIIYGKYTNSGMDWDPFQLVISRSPKNKNTSYLHHSSADSTFIKIRSENTIWGWLANL